MERGKEEKVKYYINKLNKEVKQLLKDGYTAKDFNEFDLDYVLKTYLSSDVEV